MGDTEQAVLVWIKLSDEFGTADERQEVIDLENELLTAIEEQAVGEYDGHEFGNGWCAIYTYGGSAERLHRVIAPILAESSLPSGSYLVKRYGGPGGREERIDL